MGALHDGHLSLIHTARLENVLVIASIFVNPTQFTELTDFEKYPSTIEADILKLEKAGCDILFLPSVADMYPNGSSPSQQYDLGHLDSILEGEFRPATEVVLLILSVTHCAGTQTPLMRPLS